MSCLGTLAADARVLEELAHLHEAVVPGPRRAVPLEQLGVVVADRLGRLIVQLLEVVQVER
eukprot:6044524-Pyramimonas_sp.AAC.1